LSSSALILKREKTGSKKSAKIAVHYAVIELPMAVFLFIGLTCCVIIYVSIILPEVDFAMNHSE
jgi:hypothetical protein